jgi:predicted site-specific integrase-resolvase
MLPELDDLHLHLDTAAIATGVGVSTLHRWIQNGWLQPVSRNPLVVSVTAVETLRLEKTRLRLANLKRPE